MFENPNEILAVHTADQMLAKLKESFSKYNNNELRSDGHITTAELNLCSRFDYLRKTDAIAYCREIEERYSEIDLWIWFEWFEEFIYCAKCMPKDQAPELCSICRKSDSLKFEYFIVFPDAQVVKERVAIRPPIAIGYMICPSCAQNSKTVVERAEELAVESTKELHVGLDLHEELAEETRNDE